MAHRTGTGGRVTHWLSTPTPHPYSHTTTTTRRHPPSQNAAYPYPANPPANVPTTTANRPPSPLTPDYKTLTHSLLSFTPRSTPPPPPPPSLDSPSPRRPSPSTSKPASPPATITLLYRLASFPPLSLSHASSPPLSTSFPQSFLDTSHPACPHCLLPIIHTTPPDVKNHHHTVIITPFPPSSTARTTVQAAATHRRVRRLTAPRPRQPFRPTA